MLVFGVGISLVVAPLTSTLMGSIPVARAGLGSAINNSISRVGSPLIGALVFIAITTIFYSSRCEPVAGLNPDDPPSAGDRRPAEPTAPRLAAGAGRRDQEASTEAFRFALLVCAGLLIVGAVVDFVGLRE